MPVMPLEEVKIRQKAGNGSGNAPESQTASAPAEQTSLELWGGVECTINRVGDVYFDQFARSGHRQRVEDDLARFGDLGITTLRTAMHWEHFDATGSWRSFDRLVQALEKHKIKPIIGLLHHGSGPRSTSLVDPEFPDKLAEYAWRLARRYPSLTDYTPINEPQTTGRFACLYGHWYPHERSMHCYVLALANQIRGTVLAMEAIRNVNPGARLVHTEDGGQFFSTPQLECYRAEREHRRWLGMDLLCGRVEHGHPLFAFLMAQGMTEKQVLWFQQNPCPPAVVGLNYYVTSDRFLDHRLELYPDHLPGGDTGCEPLVDFEAVRVSKRGIGGVGPILRQAWERYGIPVAITEAHLCCDEEERLRWLAEIWRDASAAKKDGVDVKAVTAWALLGSFNWNHLCMDDSGSYEAGVFELKGSDRVPTRLAALVKDLSGGRPVDSDTLNKRGWWHKPSRFTVPPA